MSQAAVGRWGFNPRSPRGGATYTLSHACSAVCLFQSTLPTRGSDNKNYNCNRCEYVSIHAPHEGERLYDPCKAKPRNKVSIHAPHGGERRAVIATANSLMLFQSTLPTRGSDSLPVLYVIRPYGFNPRSPRGGATYCFTNFCHTRHRFQSTLPTRGSDAIVDTGVAVTTMVSIHAPHEGERLCCTALTTYALSVSIHAPHEGERPGDTAAQNGVVSFQSTLPTRGSDNRLRMAQAMIVAVSIHAPHEGERPHSGRGTRILRSFNPRSPRGGATHYRVLTSAAAVFQSTLPTRGSDPITPAAHVTTLLFQSTLPTRGSDQKYL